MQSQPAIFEEHAIRRGYDEATEIWWFSVIDIIQVLTQQPDYQTARKYWNKPSRSPAASRNLRSHAPFGINYR